MWTDERIETMIFGASSEETMVKNVVQMRDELTSALFASETACAECLAENARLTAERDRLQALLHSQIATCEALQAELRQWVPQMERPVTFDKNQMVAAMEADIAEGKP